MADSTVARTSPSTNSTLINAVMKQIGQYLDHRTGGRTAPGRERRSKFLIDGS